MQNPRDAKKASLRYFKLQCTPRYLTIQYLCKKAWGCLNLPKVQWEFCQRATNQQKENGEAFFKLPSWTQGLLTEFSFYLTLRTQQQFIGNVSVGMEQRRQSLLTKNLDFPACDFRQRNFCATIYWTCISCNGTEQIHNRWLRPSTDTCHKYTV